MATRLGASKDLLPANLDTLLGCHLTRCRLTRHDARLCSRTFKDGHQATRQPIVGEVHHSFLSLQIAAVESANKSVEHLHHVHLNRSVDGAPASERCRETQDRRPQGRQKGCASSRNLQRVLCRDTTSKPPHVSAEPRAPAKSSTTRLDAPAPARGSTACRPSAAVQGVQSSWYPHVDGILEVGKLHELVVLDCQRITLEGAGRTPWASHVPAFPLESYDAVCVRCTRRDTLPHQGSGTAVRTRRYRRGRSATSSCSR